MTRTRLLPPERQDEFPGVTADEVFVRDYPEGRVGAHLYGFVSEIGPDALKEPAYDGLDPGDRIGATGIEAQYDSVLRGRNGAIRVEVDALGEPRGAELSRVEPKSGDNLVLTLDKKVQSAGQAAISQFGLPAAFVAMSVDDGSILGMGSYPDFDPSIYTPPVSTQAIETLTGDETTPLLNRATQASYVTGSTFKLVTATAALEEGLITRPSRTRLRLVLFRRTGLDHAGRQQTERSTYGRSEFSSTSTSHIGARPTSCVRKPVRSRSRTGPLATFGSLTGSISRRGPRLVPDAEWRNDSTRTPPTRLLPGKVPTTSAAVRPTVRGRRDNMNLSVARATWGQLRAACGRVRDAGQRREVVRPHLAIGRGRARAGHSGDRPSPEPDVDISEETRTTIMEGLVRRRGARRNAYVSSGVPVEIAERRARRRRPTRRPSPCTRRCARRRPADRGCRHGRAGRLRS